MFSRSSAEFDTKRCGNKEVAHLSMTRVRIVHNAMRKAVPLLEIKFKTTTYEPAFCLWVMQRHTLAQGFFQSTEALFYERRNLTFHHSNFVGYGIKISANKISKSVALRGFFFFVSRESSVFLSRFSKKKTTYSLSTHDLWTGCCCNDSRISSGNSGSARFWMSLNLVSKSTSFFL